MRKSAAAAVAIVAKYFAHRPTNRVIECTSYKVHVQAWPFLHGLFQSASRFSIYATKDLISLRIFTELSLLNCQLKYVEP